MVRGLPFERCCLLLTALLLSAGAAEAADTSRPTGRGAIHDNSVYCQNSPGQPARPAYRGTGSQNPFGGECGRGPAVQPSSPPQAEEDACPLRQAATPRAGIVLAANGAAPTAGGADVRPGLWVAGHKVLNARQVSLAQLSGRRKEIFEAMRCHRTRAFRFQDARRLRDTIELRVEVLERMDERIHGTATSCFLTETGGLLLPHGWEEYPEENSTVVAWRSGRRVAARSLPGVGAHQAVQALRSERSGLDCHLGMQVAVLDAAERVLGAARFDGLHPQQPWPHFVAVRPDGTPARYALIGLGVALLSDTDAQEVTLFPGGTILGQQLPRIQFGFGIAVLRNASLTSLAKHLLVVRYDVQGGQPPAGDMFAGRIKAEDMVPGDWAYLKNVPGYETYVPNGANAGENVFYMGELTRGDPTSRVFFGVGLEQLGARFLTEAELRTHLADDFNHHAPQRPPARPEQMTWTRLGGPMLDDSNPAEAGLFVR
ncbi:MAG TPA: hypothetical protein VFV80_10265 [Geminicoccaceae bacterium]|nr:hypothetical protein [Geminicoccaceae bacterium]